MKPPGSTIDQGVLRILRDRHVRRAGDSVGLTEILAMWKLSRLRHDDLLASLKRLQAEGSVRLERDARGARYLLTEKGEQAMDKIPEGVPGVLYLIGTTATDGEVPRRDRVYTPDGRKRRKTDQKTFESLPDVGSADEPTGTKRS